LNRLKTKIVPFMKTFLFISCSNKDQQFCDCLKAGEELNDKTKTVFNHVVTQKLHKEIQELKAKKKSACKDYQTMSGKDMLELKKECK